MSNADKFKSQAAAKKGANHQPSADKTSGKGDPKPKQEIKSRKGQVFIRFGFSKAKWREIAGFVVLIPWIYNDLFDSHNISKLLLLAISLAIAQGVVFSFLQSHAKALAFWFFSLVPLVFVVWLNSKPNPAPFPHFVIQLMNPTISESRMDFTNEFFNADKLGFSLPIVRFVTSDSNIDLTFGVKNQGPVEAENAEVHFSFQANLSCDADAGWEKININPGDPKSKSLRTVRFPIGHLFAGYGQSLPPVHIHDFPIAKSHDDPITSCVMIFSVKAKDAPSQDIAFFASFMMVPTNMAMESPGIALTDMQSNGFRIFKIVQ